MTDDADPTGPLTILHVVPSLHVGGVNRSLIASLAALRPHGDHHVVAVVGTKRSLEREVRSLGVPVVVLGHRGRRDLPRTFRRLSGVVAGERVDVVHAHLLLARTVGGLVARRRGVPVVATIHNHRSAEVAPARGRARLRSGVVRRSIDRWATDVLVAVSPPVADAYRQADPVVADRIEVVPNGIDVEAWAPRPAAERSAVRRSLGVDEGTALLVNVGRMVREKAQRSLVPVVGRLVAAGRDVVLVVAGDGMERASVEAAVAEAGLGERFRCLGVRSDVQALLGAADVVVISSVTEGFSVAALEAMALAAPIVATDVPGVTAALRPGRDALIVPPGDPGSFAAAIGHLLDDRERANELGRAARASVAQRFSIEGSAAALTSIYHRLARPGGQSPAWPRASR